MLAVLARGASPGEAAATLGWTERAVSVQLASAGRKLGARSGLELLGHEVDMNGRGWRDVRDPTDGAEGWVAVEFLGPAG